MRTITDMDIFNYTQCKYRVYQDHRSEKNEETVIGDFMTLLWGMDPLNEEELRKTIAQKSGKTHEIISLGKIDETEVEALAEKTKKAMESGVELIFGAVIHSPGKADLFEQAPALLATVPLLSKVSSESALGDYSYAPTLLQSGSAMLETDWGPKYHQGYLQRLSFILKLLEQAYGISSDRAFVTGSDGKPVAYPASATEKTLDETMGRVRQLVEGYTAETEPVIGSMCDKCKWKDVCRNEAESRDELTLLFYAGEKVKYGFYEIGINSIGDLASADLEKTWEKVQAGIKRRLFYKSFDKALLTRLIRRAELYMKAKEAQEGEFVYEIRSNAQDFPESQSEIHYDIEDDPINGFVYLHGFWIIESGKDPRFEYFFAESEADEEKVSKQLWSFFEEHEGVPIYHYSGHEAHTCKRLMEKYDLSESVYEQVFGMGGSATDLYEWIVRYTDWPLTSYGLKPLCKYTGFTWTAEDAGGAQSIDWLYQYQDGNDAMKEKILTYNKEDCMATAHLKKWLLDHK